MEKEKKSHISLKWREGIDDDRISSLKDIMVTLSMKLVFIIHYKGILKAL